MSVEKGKVAVELPVKYEKVRKILEFPLYKVKDGESIIVRTKKWAGLAELCYVVTSKNGEITIKRLKEE
jgi:hypothetical protein